MLVTLNLKSTRKNTINNFLEKFYNQNLNLNEHLVWKKEYENPIEISDIIGVYVDNFDSFDLDMWISLDKDIYINVTKNNANELIKYLFERYPY